MCLLIFLSSWGPRFTSYQRCEDIPAGSLNIEHLGTIQGPGSRLFIVGSSCSPDSVLSESSQVYLCSNNPQQNWTGCSRSSPDLSSSHSSTSLLYAAECRVLTLEKFSHACLIPSRKRRSYRYKVTYLLMYQNGKVSVLPR